MRRYVDRREVHRRNLDETVHLTGYDAIYGHARFVKALRAVCGFKPRWVGFEPLEGPRIAVDGLRRKVYGAVPVKWAPNERSCLIPFGPVLAEHEELSVELGWIRKLPFFEEDGRIVIDLKNWQLARSEISRRRAAARERWRRMSREEKEAFMAKAVAKRREQLRRILEEHKRRVEARMKAGADGE